MNIFSSQGIVSNCLWLHAKKEVENVVVCVGCIHGSVMNFFGIPFVPF